MKLSLKKARKLDRKIQNRIGELTNELSSSSSFSITDNDRELDNFVKFESNNFHNKLDTLNNLITARQHIRDLIRVENENQEVNSLISKKLLLQAKLEAIGRFSEAKVFDKKRVLGEIKAIKTVNDNATNAYRMTLDVNVPILSSDSKLTIDQERVKLARQVEEIEDELIERNFTAKIDLSVNTVKLLQANNLL